MGIHRKDERERIHYRGDITMIKLKRFFIGWAAVVLCLVLGTTVLAQSGARTASTDIYARNYTYGGTNRVAYELTNLVNDIPITRPVRLHIDGGPWTINANVDFTTNITLVMYPGCPFNVSTGIVMSFSNNPLSALDWPIFTGWGTATGNCDFIYRWPDWGDEGRFRIGDGQLGTNIWNTGTNNLITITATNGIFENITVNSTGTFDHIETASLNVTTTNFVVAGRDMAAQESITIGLSNDMSTAEIVAKIATVRKFVPYPNNVFFQFSNGVYALTSRLTFQSFYGGGHIYVQGDTTEDGGGSSERNVTLDFSSGNRPGLYIHDNDCQVIVRKLKIQCKTDASPTVGDLYAPVGFYRTGYGQVTACALWGTSTNSGDGIHYSDGMQGYCESNVFVSINSGVRISDSSQVTLKDCTSALTNPCNGMIVQSAIGHRRGLVITGAVANVLTNYGGVTFGP